MRRLILPVTLSLAMLATTGALANDQIYKCIDQNGATVLSDQACAVIESIPADPTPVAEVPVADAAVSGATVSDEVAAVPAVAPARSYASKEYFKLPQAEPGQGQRAGKSLFSTPPKVDVATLKAAKLRLEMEDKMGSQRQASLN